MGLRQQEIAAMEGALAEFNKSSLAKIDNTYYISISVLRLGGEGGGVSRAAGGGAP